MRGGGEAFSPQTSTHISPPITVATAAAAPIASGGLGEPQPAPKHLCCSGPTCSGSSEQPDGWFKSTVPRAFSSCLFLLLLLLLLLRVKPARDEVRSGGHGSRKRQNCSEFPASKMRNNNPERSDAARLPHLHAACLALARLGCPCSAESTPPLGPYHCPLGGEKHESIKRLNFHYFIKILRISLQIILFEN